MTYTPIAGGGGGVSTSGPGPDSDFTLVFTGSDLVTGASYSRTVRTFGDALTGSLSITPSAFWDYQDDNGNPLYDEVTGAPL